MNVIKRHMGLAIVLGLSLLFLIVLGIILWPMIFDNGKGEYGDRLEGVTKIENSLLKDAEVSLSENEAVEKANVRVQGKIIYTTLTVKEGTSKSSAKEIASKVIEKFSEEIVKEYDFGFLIHENKEVKEDDENSKAGYTIAGTKHPLKEKISWTKD